MRARSSVVTPERRPPSISARRTHLRRVTVGVDLGDRTSQCCVLGEDGQVREEFSLPTTQQSFQRRFSGQEQACIVLEAGLHSPWASPLLGELSHQVIVANPRRLRLIYGNDSKNDRADATCLARVGMKLEKGVGFLYGCGEFALKNPPPLVPSSLMATWEATGPTAMS
jgi:hypothetical protein